MLDQNEVAVTAQLVAGVGDDSLIGGFNGSAARGGDIDAVVMGPIPSRPVTGDDMPTNRYAMAG